MIHDAKTYIGDCLDILEGIKHESIDLIYIDPPFFTQKTHQLSTRDGALNFSFNDIWDDDNAYANFIHQRLVKAWKVLKPSGSLFFHCDRSAAHIIRLLLDRIFSPENFQAEIIWHFKRWSNSRKGLLPAHQTIFFYSKTEEFKFNQAFQEYAPSTNVDQIMQKRTRDERNKSVYARRDDGNIINNRVKKGVPLSDVWEIPFLNPKAKERVGYPTQKPVLLLKKIIQLVTDEGDTVLDPFCGSGTTLVAAKTLGRQSIGIDVSEDAINLTHRRLDNPIVTKSALLEKGVNAYRQHSTEASSFLTGIDYIPVHRNKGIDGLLKQRINGVPIFVRVQRHDETVTQASMALKKATRNKGECNLIIVATKKDLFQEEKLPDVNIVSSASRAISNLLRSDNMNLAKLKR